MPADAVALRQHRQPDRADEPEASDPRTPEQRAHRANAALSLLAWQRLPQAAAVSASVVVMMLGSTGVMTAPLSLLALASVLAAWPLLLREPSPQRRMLGCRGEALAVGAALGIVLAQASDPLRLAAAVALLAGACLRERSAVWLMLAAAMPGLLVFAAQGLPEALISVAVTAAALAIGRGLHRERQRLVRAEDHRDELAAVCRQLSGEVQPPPADAPP